MGGILKKEVCPMALRYKNKRKRKGYWKRYDRARIKDFRKIFQFSLQIIKKLGCPFPKKDNRGRKPKFPRAYYAAFCIVMAYFDLSLRDMEGEIPLLTRKTFDHSNVDRWFEKLDEDYITEAVKHLHRKVKKMFRKGEYIVDSTKITTTRYYKMIHKGEETIELICLKLHLLITYFRSVGILSIANLFVSHGDAHDSPIFNEELIEGVELQRNKRLHGDKGYFSRDNIIKCIDKGLSPNFVPKDNINEDYFWNKYLMEYDDEARKQNRGLIEGIFGGTTIETDDKTRFVKDKCRKTHIALMALSHEIKTYFRALEHKSITLIYVILQQPPIFR